MIVITGCGRSGTTRISKLINLCGQYCPFEPEVNTSRYVADCKVKVSWLAPSVFKPSDRVWHVHRHPLQVALSYRNLNFFQSRSPHRDVVDKTIGMDYLKDSIPELTFWIEWNKLVSERAEKRFHTSEFDADMLRALFVQLGTEPQIVPDAKKILADDKYNHVKNNGIQLGDVSKYERLSELIDMAGAYGYEDLQCQVTQM